MTDTQTRTVSCRRDLLAASLLGTLPLLLADGTHASPLNPEQTIIRSPDALPWVPSKGYPERSVDRCALTGDINGTGLYYTLIRWWPGYMSAPHTYTTDRFCMVLAGTWWCTRGADSAPAAGGPVTPRRFARRAAGPPHTAGAARDGPEPAVIAICGVAPVHYRLVDPSQPGWRRV